MAEKNALELQAKALSVARIYYQTHLSDPEAQSYLNERQLDRDACRKFELGYAPNNYRGLVETYHSNSVLFAAKDAGVVSTLSTSNRLIDFFRGRLMFPIRTHDGALVGYGGRQLADDPEKKSPKYINTPETELFKKNQTLFGLYNHLPKIRSQQEVILVEGYMDVIRLSCNGFDYAAAPMGTALTDAQVHLLLDLGVKHFWICLDGDKAGAAATERSISVIMQNHSPEMSISIITLPAGQDPDSLIAHQGSAAFAHAKEHAVSLENYIHNICCAGFSSQPALEDLALYLVRLEPYLDNASGALEDSLIQQASDYTGLSIEEVHSKGKNLAARKAMQQWHPLTCMMARLLCANPNNRPMIDQICLLPNVGHGINELVQMATEMKSGRTPESDIYHFGVTHGPLLEHEWDYLETHWPTWSKQITLEADLQSLNKNPFDEGAKQNIKKTLRAALG